MNTGLIGTIQRAAKLAGWAVPGLIFNFTLHAVAQDAPTGPRLTVTEVWVADGHTRLEGLTRVTGVAESPLGKVWITSARPARLLVVDPATGGEGDFIAARDGDGPGELRGPARLDIMPDGNMAVYDLSRSALEIYTSDGKPVRRVMLPIAVSWPKGFAALASGGFVLSGGVLGNDFAIHQFGELGRYIRSWAAAMDAESWEARPVGTGGALDALPDGSLLYSRGAPHEILQFEVPAVGNGKPPHRTLAAMEGLLQEPGDDVLVHGTEDGIPFTTFDVWYPQSRAVFQLDDGRVLNVITRSDGGAPRTIWQLFETDGGVPIQTQTDGQLYEPWFLCANGDILATRRDALDVASVVRLRLALDGEASSR